MLLGLSLAAGCLTEPSEPTGEQLLAAILGDPGLAARAEIRRAPENHFDRLLRAYDTNLDHELTPAELVGRDFTRFDSDGSGRVTLADFPGESGELAPRIARALDLTIARSAVRRTLGADWQVAFRLLDVDADMRLSRAEFEVGVQSGEAGRRDPFAALLASVGSWDDDLLDWSEVDGLVD